MTAPPPLTDAALDRLLAGDHAPPFPFGLADRIVAEAQRADRVPALAPTPLRRPGRRLWGRPRFVAGFVALNLIAVSAIAAAWSGGVIDVHRLAALSTHIFHHRHVAAPPVHKIHKARAAQHTTAPAAMPSPPQGLVATPDPAPRWMMRHDRMPLRALIRERRRQRALAGLPPRRMEARRLVPPPIARAERRQAIMQGMPAAERRLRPWQRPMPEAAPMELRREQRAQRRAERRFERGAMMPPRRMRFGPRRWRP